MKLPWLWFSLQVLPYTLLAWAATALGMRLAPERWGSATALVATILGLLAFAALLAWRDRPNRILPALLALAFIAGLELGGGDLQGAAPLARASLLGGGAAMLIAVGVAPWLGRRLWRLRGALWAGSLLCLVCWAAMATLRVGQASSRLPAGIGMGLLMGLLTVWFSALPGEGDGRGHAAELYLLSLSLTLLAQGAPATR